MASRIVRPQCFSGLPPRPVVLPGGGSNGSSTAHWASVSDHRRGRSLPYPSTRGQRRHTPRRVAMSTSAPTPAGSASTPPSATSHEGTLCEMPVHGRATDPEHFGDLGHHDPLGAQSLRLTKLGRGQRAGPATPAAAGARRIQAGARPLDDHAALHLGQRTHDVKQEFAACGAGVEPLGERSELPRHAPPTPRRSRSDAVRNDQAGRGARHTACHRVADDPARQRVRDGRPWRRWHGRSRSGCSRRSSTRPLAARGSVRPSTTRA